MRFIACRLIFKSESSPLEEGGRDYVFSRHKLIRWLLSDPGFSGMVINRPRGLNFQEALWSDPDVEWEDSLTLAYPCFTCSRRWGDRHLLRLIQSGGWRKGGTGDLSTAGVCFVSLCFLVCVGFFFFFFFVYYTLCPKTKRPLKHMASPWWP